MTAAIEWLFMHSLTVAAILMALLLGMLIGHWQEYKMPYHAGQNGGSTDG
ncbi:hypothetical protein [Lacticaseibacillus paracasei]